MTTSEKHLSRNQLFALLPTVSLIDERNFRRRLAKARSPKALSAIHTDILRSQKLFDERAAAIPSISYPAALPVSARKEDIAAAISEHQVVIIAGETGSGKTTQIPKICLELGRGRRGLIGHTQPRRLAARTVAERIADELGQSIGETVGYAIRFDDKVSASTSIKLMTDGILLAEMQRDRFLNAYDTIIIDEAHERSLNIDFLLGYLKQLLPKRPDLKIIITSATIDPERFAAHFSEPSGNPAPVIEVSGRTFPVEIRYRPVEDNDPLEALCQAVEELMGEGSGDILCFFAGERDIRDAVEALEGRKWKGLEILPLFGRLSNQEQHRVFGPHTGRRIVLSTNIAETSLTVPGIHYVIDTGTARISRYSLKTKVQRLPIEAISQASANQRSGRCGRIAEGIAIRLYSESDFESRPEFSDPEILRTNLASVILKMVSLKLGDITDFPFIQEPDRRSIRDGLLLLHELGALVDNAASDGSPALTPIGQSIAQIPVDPRMARMLVEANRLGALHPVIIIVAAMTIQDVRERPMEFQAQADQAHARFKDTSSDFLSFLKLWEYIAEQRDLTSGNSFRKQMKKEFLHYMRIREWWDLVRQLEQVSQQLGWSAKSSVAGNASTDIVHQSLLSGLLSQIGSRNPEGKEFNGSRGTKFLIFPGSTLAKKPPQFVMAGELVETSKLWARDVARIEPEWVEHLAGQLLKHQYSEPFWSTKRGAAMVHQRSTLYGVTIVADKIRPYHVVDPLAARDMFIRHALVQGEWTTHHNFFHKNALLLEEVSTLEAKARRRDIVVDEDTLFEFYDSKVPHNVTTSRHFDSWWKKTRQEDSRLLDFDPEKLINDDAESVSETAFPDKWEKNGLLLDLRYHFEPGHKDDGVTVLVPVPVLGGLDTEGFEWLVPGLRLELVTELIRTLPKPIRRSFVPAPDFAKRVVPQLKPYISALTSQLAAILYRMSGVLLNSEDFKLHSLPSHLRITYAAIDKRGKIVDQDKELSELKQRREKQIQSSVSQIAYKTEIEEVPSWTSDSLGSIEEQIDTIVDGQRVTTYPALVVTPTGVSVRVLPTKTAADSAMITSTLTLLMREIEVPTNQMIKGLTLQQRVAVDNYPHGGANGLVQDARVAAIRDLMIAHGGAVRDPHAFDQLLETIKPAVPREVRRTIVNLAPALVQYSALTSELERWSGPAIDDVRTQLDYLLPKQAVSIHGISRLQHLPRYIQAISIRLEEMNRDPNRDADRQNEVAAVERELEDRLQKLPKNRIAGRAVKDITWQIQEFRVSLFAQRLGTPAPVSAKRIKRMIENIH